MPKNKKGHPSLEELLDRPWCYYCERDFEDLKILIDHQKHKHFKCERCGRRLNTAGGLSVHLNHVHKETLGPIENALPNRSSHEIEIFGMEGIPDEVVSAHKQRVITTYAQAEAERRATSGNAGGGGGGNPAKKPKTESISEMKKRLAEHKAKKATDESAASTPTGSNVGATPPEVMNGPPATYPHQPVSGSYNGHPGSYNGVNGAAMYGAPPQQYSGQPSPAYPPQHIFQAPSASFPNQPPHFPPAGMPPQQQFPQAPFPQPYSNGSLPFQGGPQHPFSPNNMINMQGPAQSMPPTQRPTSISPAPGLPQRPSFSTPPVNASQMQQMHHGMNPNGPGTNMASLKSPIGQQSGTITSLPGSTDQPQAELALPSHTGAPLTTTTENGDKAEGTEKKKKDKDKEVRLVYSDNDISPEEKMAKLPRYAFNPADHKENIVLRDAVDGEGSVI